MRKYLSKIFTAVVCLQLLTISHLNAQTGTWTALTHTAPHYNEGVMLLLTDGTVICHTSSGGGDGTVWDKLTPDTSGSYVNGTWSSITPMYNDRLYFSAQVLPNGEVFIAGGEYGNGDTAGEVYNPVTNAWTRCRGIPSGWGLVDAPSELLYTGNVLDGPEGGNNPSFNCLFYTPSTNLFSLAPSSLDNHDEAQWLKLPDSSVLFVGIGSRFSNRYIPQTNTWVHDGTVPVSIYDTYGEEAGPGFMLPNGKAIFFGGAQYNAIYTPTGNPNPGTWTAAANFPAINGAQTGQPDAPGAMMVNGHILLAVSPAGTSGNDEFRSPVYFLEYDYTTNTFTQVTSILPGFGADSLAGYDSFETTMLDLPDGNILFGCFSRQYFVYTPGSAPIAQGKPTINSILPDGCPNYKITGKLFNGISEGSAYGDDWQMATNYPLVRLTDGTHVYYAKTTDWNRLGDVQTDSLEDTCVFTPPAALPAGTYSLYIVVNGFASNPVLFSVFGISLVSATNISCSGTGGIATVSLSGGLSPYTYSWSNGETTAVLTGLSGGTYSVTMSDNDDCTATASVTITQPANIMHVNALVTANANCRITGSDSAFVSGGVPPYTYMWSDGHTQTTIVATGLTAGVYVVTVTDNAGCSGTASNTVTQPTVLNLTATVNVNVSCNGGSNGSESVSVSGGVSPYTYLWSDANSQTTATATGLSAGTYIVLVTDSNGCYETVSSTITQPAILTVSTTVNARVSCDGGSNGAVSVSVSGGSMPYTYLWSGIGSQTTAAVSGLSTGTYTITVQDNCGASVTASAFIAQPSAITVSASVTANVSCDGGSDAIVSASVSGGTMPYTYLWNNAGGQTTASASGLSTGTYTVTVSDSCGASATASVITTQPGPLVVAGDSLDATMAGVCDGAAWVTVSGGTIPYTYSWNFAAKTTDTIAGRCASTYCCKVTDAGGCTGSVCVTIVIATAIDEVKGESEKVKVYPNPNNGTFTIALSHAELVSASQPIIELYNVLGEKIYDATLKQVQGDNIINISSQPNGIYFYRVITGDGSLVGEGKLVIVK